MSFGKEEISNLRNALKRRFVSEEAENLAVILLCGCCNDSICYEEIDIAQELKDDMILLAHEERMLLPMKSRLGSAWEDRILDFTEEERYHIPRVVRFMVHNAQSCGEWNCTYAVEEALREAGENNIKEMDQFLNRLIEVAPKYELDIEIIKAIKNELGFDMDMHDTLDRFVRCGIMSPRTGRSLYTGSAKYEINPCLYWDS